MKTIVWTAALGLALAGAGWGAVIQVNGGLRGEFVAATQTLVLSSDEGNPGWAVVETPSGPHLLSGKDIRLEFSAPQDLSADGMLAGYYLGQGAWHLTLYNLSNPVLQLAGGLFWYLEEEGPPQMINGTGILSVTHVLGDQAYWGQEGANWNYGPTFSSFEITLTQFDKDIVDYSQGFSAGQVSFTMVLPEPASVLLLGLGLGTIRRRARRCV